MRVRFGLHRGGLEPTLARTAIGEITVGPLAFLSLLESDLGVPPVATHPSESVAAYRACLAERDDKARFYHASFDIDPVGVARTLNEWRQRWYLHGWDGTFSDAVGGRLGDMALVEALAVERVPPGIGQRLRTVLKLLQRRRVQVREVELLDDPDDLPTMWQRVVAHFDCLPLPAAGDQAPGASDLGKLQGLLSRGVAQPLSGDGSLVVVRAFSRDVTAQATAEMLRQLDDPARAVVIASRDGIILDNALERARLPRAGFQHYSPFRAANQVLKLALALIWQPLDPHRLLQFLIHPVSPLPWRVRGRLAEAVAAQPGIGGPEWRKAMAGIGDAVQAVEFWTMSTRYDPGQGAPMAAIGLRVARIVSWLATRLATAGSDEERAGYSAAYSQATALASTFEQLAAGGQESVRKIELDCLVDEATRSTPDVSSVSEAGHVPVTRHPGNITDTTDHVFWWDLAPARRDLTPPWSDDELETLGSAGVHLPAAGGQLAAERRAWLRPVLNCHERLVLVVHDEGEGRHPLWGRIQEQLKQGWVEVRLDEALLGGAQDPLSNLAIPALPLPPKRLPEPRRWWCVGQPLSLRETESYTSLSETCYYPHEWVLTYAAKLRTGGINEVADGPILKGTLAHRLFERFFTERDDWQSLDEQAIHRWLDRTIGDLIEKEGAVLLENGRGVDRQQVITTLEYALTRLLDHLRAADVRSVKSEQSIQRSFRGGVLLGKADLVVVDARGNEAVLDAKWGSEKYRKEEIEASRHLQLAVYGYALGESGWPGTGYYIVTTGNVVAPDERFFPKAIAAGGEDIKAIWRKSLVTRGWRLGQLAEGKIEVNAGAEPDDDSRPPEGGLDTLVEPDRFDEFRWLTGVERFR